MPIRPIFAFILCFLSFVLSATAATPTPSLQAQVYDLLEKQHAGKPVDNKAIIDFVYAVSYPEGGDCCEAKAGADIIIIPIASLGSSREGFLVAVPSPDSGMYNTNYDMIVLASSPEGLKAWPLIHNTYYDKKTNSVQKQDEIINKSFSNIGYDLQTGTLTSTNLGNSMGYCTTREHYRFVGEAFEMVKVTQTDDCDIPLKDVVDEPKTVTIYEKYPASLTVEGSKKR